MAKGCTYFHQIMYIMGNGIIIKCKVMGYIYLLMDKSIKDSLKMEKNMDLEYIRMLII